MNKKELINSGKVKSVFTTDDDDKVIIEFRDDMTAGDGERKEVMNKKGAYNAVISAKIFKVLEENGVETQFIDLPEPDVMLARKLDMIPIEVIVRNIATGSLIRKYPIADGTRLEPPIVQMDFKADEYHDPMLNDSIIKALGIATQEEIDTLTEKALKINEVLKEFFADAGIILVDYKVEFGKDKDGNIILGDEISPDSCRLWDSETLDMLDKELFRKGNRKDIQDLRELVIKSKLDTAVKVDFLDYISADDDSVLEPLRKLIYDFTSAKDAIESSKSANDINMWVNSVVELLSPSIKDYSNRQINLALALLIYEQSVRDAAYNDLFCRFTEVYRAEGRVY